MIWQHLYDPKASVLAASQLLRTTVNVLPTSFGASFGAYKLFSFLKRDPGPCISIANIKSTTCSTKDSLKGQSLALHMRSRRLQSRSVQLTQRCQSNTLSNRPCPHSHHLSRLRLASLQSSTFAADPAKLHVAPCQFAA